MLHILIDTWYLVPVDYSEQSKLGRRKRSNTEQHQQQQQQRVAIFSLLAYWRIRHMNVYRVFYLVPKTTKTLTRSRRVVVRGTYIMFARLRTCLLLQQT